MAKYKVYCDRIGSEVGIEKCFDCEYFEGCCEDDEGYIELVNCRYAESLVKVKKLLTNYEK